MLRFIITSLIHTYTNLTAILKVNFSLAACFREMLHQILA